MQQQEGGDRQWHRGCHVFPGWGKGTEEFQAGSNLSWSLCWKDHLAAVGQEQQGRITMLLPASWCMISVRIWVLDEVTKLLVITERG
jgi:hypothetical protein